MRKHFFILNLLIFGLCPAQEKWTLRQCVDYATEHNLTIQQAKIQEDLSKTNLESTQNQWLPTINGYFDNSLTLGTHHPAINKGYQQYSNSLGVNSSISIYQGGLLELNKEKADLLVNSSQLQTETNINDISLLVVNYYLNVMLNRELLQIAEGNLDLGIQQNQRSQKLFDAGRIARAELVQTEANVAQERKNVADTKIEVDRAIFNLSMLLQLPDYREFDVETIQLPEEIGLGLYDLEQILQIAYAQQPNVKRAEIDLQAASKDIDIAKTGFKPSINGTYNLGTSYADYFNKGLMTDAWLSQWYDNITSVFGVQIQFPIFEKHNNKLNVQKAKINESIAQITVEQEKQKIKENVQEAYFNAHSSYEAYLAAKESVRSNELSADFAQKSFDAGVLNNYDLNTARNSLAIAKSQMAQAKYNFIFRMKVLDFYAGRSLTEGLE